MQKERSKSKSSGKSGKSRHRPKPLPPTMRTKKRYLYFQLASQHPLSFAEVNSAIWQEFFSLYGSQGCARICLNLIEFDSLTGKGILCFNRAFETEVKAGFLFLRRVGDKTIIPKTLLISGTLKKLRSKRGKS